MSTDSDLLGLLEAVDSLNVYDGFVNTDASVKVISVPLPYVVFYSSPGFDINERQNGGVGGRAVEFQITGVGGTREQAKWALDKARTALSRVRLDGALIRRSDDNQPVRRDDEFTRTGGGPLFYGVDRYTVAV